MANHKQRYIVLIPKHCRNIGPFLSHASAERWVSRWVRYHNPTRGKAMARRLKAMTQIVLLESPKEGMH